MRSHYIVLIITALEVLTVQLHKRKQSEEQKLGGKKVALPPFAHADGMIMYPQK